MQDDENILGGNAGHGFEVGSDARIERALHRVAAAPAHRDFHHHQPVRACDAIEGARIDVVLRGIGRDEIEQLILRHADRLDQRLMNPLHNLHTGGFIGIISHIGAHDGQRCSPLDMMIASDYSEKERGLNRDYRRLYVRKIQMIRHRGTLPLNALRAFEATARLGRATAAAGELGVTHGAISRQIAHLEKVLNVELFAGTRARPELSQIGRALSADLTPIFDALEAALRPILSHEEGLLQVACFSSFAVRWIIPRLHRFSARHPGIDVRLGTALGQLDERARNYDIAITSVEDEAMLRPSDQLLFREEIGPVVAPHLLSEGAEAPALAAFKRLVSQTRPQAFAEWSEGRPAHEGLAAGAPVFFEHYHFALQAALSGLGVCVAPRHLVADDIAAGRLVAPLSFRQTRYCYLLRGLDRRNLKAARFAQWLTEELTEAR